MWRILCDSLKCLAKLIWPNLSWLWGCLTSPAWKQLVLTFYFLFAGKESTATPDQPYAAASGSADLDGGRSDPWVLSVQLSETSGWWWIPTVAVSGLEFHLHNFQSSNPPFLREVSVWNDLKDSLWWDKALHTSCHSGILSYPGWASADPLGSCPAVMGWLWCDLEISYWHTEVCLLGVDHLLCGPMLPDEKEG